MKLSISSAAKAPIYQQIKEQIQAAILSGDLQPGEALPSLRTLAKELRISVLTVTRAYTELEQEGFVANVQGKGCFVQGRENALLQEQLLRRAEALLEEGVTLALQAGLSSAEIHAMLTALLQEKGV